MTLHARDFFAVPEETARVARRIFRKGNLYMKIRDQLGFWYHDSDFAHLFTSVQGRPAESPGRLALITVLQFLEGLTDRQAAEAVRARIDWKYLLGLPLEDPGFDYSVLHDYRARVQAGGAEQQLLDDLLRRCQELGWLKAGGRQRTDSTHVLSAARRLNRLENVGETLRAALEALAVVAPESLRAHVDLAWFERYGMRWDEMRLPKAEGARAALVALVGTDGYQLLAALADPAAPGWLREVPAVQLLQQVWAQQYIQDGGTVRWRTEAELPPLQEMIQTPADSAARNRTKRKLNWTGYAVQLTETCDEDTPHLITQVETTPASTDDASMVEKIHTALAAKALLPGTHIVDMAYVDAARLVASAQVGVDLYGPVAKDASWQAQAGQGFDIAHFRLDWAQRQATCPAGQVSERWRDRLVGDRPAIEVRFARADCAACGSKAHCTRSAYRQLKLLPQAEYEALQAARHRQTQAEFKTGYKQRAGIEGTISQGTRSTDLRRSRYVGLAKTHFQNIVIAAAINLKRAIAWLDGAIRAQTRRSHFAALQAAA